MKLILTWKYLQKKKKCPYLFNIELVKWRFNIIYDFIRIISPIFLEFNLLTRDINILPSLFYGKKEKEVLTRKN